MLKKLWKIWLISYFIFSVEMIVLPHVINYNNNLNHIKTKCVQKSIKETTPKELFYLTTAFVVTPVSATLLGVSEYMLLTNKIQLK